MPCLWTSSSSRRSSKVIGWNTIAGRLVAGLSVELVLSVANTTGQDANALQAVAPSSDTLAQRCLLNVLFEMLTDGCKNIIFWRVFKVLPARVNPNLRVFDKAFLANMVVCAAGMILTGVAMAV